MQVRVFLAGLVLVASGLLAGCGGGGKLSPFEGDWVSATAGRLSFDESHWRDSDGDGGEYTFSGDYPEYTVVFRSGAGQFQKLAFFADRRTFDLCDQGAGGALIDCHEFVLDKPTLH